MSLIWAIRYLGPVLLCVSFRVKIILLRNLATLLLADRYFPELPHTVTRQKCRAPNVVFPWHARSHAVPCGPRWRAACHATPILFLLSKRRHLRGTIFVGRVWPAAIYFFFLLKEILSLACTANNELPCSKTFSIFISILKYLKYLPHRRGKAYTRTISVTLTHNSPKYLE